MNLTAVINNFKRPDYFDRCVSSLYQHFPSVEVVEVCDENLSRARNTGLKKVRSPYVLFCDDDMEFTKDSDLGSLMSLMSIADIVGGHVEGLEYQGDFKFEEGNVRYMRARGGSEYHGIEFQMADFIPNFFVANVKRIGRKPFDESMRIAWEHIDFFLSMKRRGLQVVYAPNSVVKHEKTWPMSDEYLAARADDASSKKAFFDKWGFKMVTSMEDAIILPDNV